MTRKPAASASGHAVLIVDDEEAICWSLRRALERRGKTVYTAATAEVGLRLAEQENPAVIYLDIRLPGMDGLQMLERLRERTPARVVMMTAFGDLTTAVRALNGGAFDYLLKPFDLDQALAVADRALAADVPPPGPSAAAIGWSEVLVGRTPAMQEVFKRIALVAGRDTCVLISGESGTGKEMVARAIHQHGPRRDQPFVPVHMAAVHAERLECDLFGSVQGGQVIDGWLGVAKDGTILMDEVGDLPLETQAKLLRVLEQGEYWPVGSGVAVPLKARVIATSQRDLEAAVAAGRFRADLWYRLNTFPIRVPPLRERMEDLPALVEQIVTRLDPRLWPVPAETLAHLREQPWPGNVRELRNVLEHAAILARGGPLRPEHLPPVRAPGEPALAIPQAVRRWVEQTFRTQGVPGELHAALLREAEPALLREVMRHAKGNRWRAARWLGLTRTTLRKKLAQYGLTEAFRPTGSRERSTMTPPPPGAMPIATAAALACMFEVMSGKAGNIHPAQPAAHATAIDFLAAGQVVAPVLAATGSHGVGPTILDAIRQTRRVTAANPNLGVVLLLAPLAAVPDGQPWSTGIREVLASLTVADASAAYAAIRLAQPRGLGEVPEQDVHSEPTETLTAVMTRAAGYDLVARQYAENFEEILEFGHTTLLTALQARWPLERAIINLQLHWLAKLGDTLVARLYGPDAARAVALGAKVVLDSGWPDSRAGQAMFRDFDRWLRDAAQPKNPGAVADLVVACLFVALRSGTLELPLTRPWPAALDPSSR